jgi:uroporphyrinogen decarboxylase
MIRIYHNDTPCAHLYPALAEANFDVFNFTHKADIAEVKATMGHRVAMMGNVPPLDIGVRATPEVVAEWAKGCLDRAAPGGGMILSVGGGVSPGMPAENIEAMVTAARDWTKPAQPPADLPGSGTAARSGSGTTTGKAGSKSTKGRRPRPRRS